MRSKSCCCRDGYRGACGSAGRISAAPGPCGPSSPARSGRGRTGRPCSAMFGPLSMLTLFALWAAALIVGFGLLEWALQGKGRLARLRASLYERRHLLHPRLRRRGAAHRGGPAAGGGGGGDRDRLYRRRDRLPAGPVSVLLPARGACDPARCARRVATHGGRHAVPARRSATGWRARRVSARLGGVGGRAAREPSLLPDARLLPLAARQPVLADRARRR